LNRHPRHPPAPLRSSPLLLETVDARRFIARKLHNLSASHRGPHPFGRRGCWKRPEQAELSGTGGPKGDA
jgi:hypothetical protein